MAATQGHMATITAMGVVSLNKGEHHHQEAMWWFHMNAGDRISQYSVGRFYFSGENDEDAAIAMEWFQKSVNQKYGLAAFALGRMYSGGIGVEENLTKAIVWYTKAAEYGDSEAFSDLGECLAKMYRTGRNLFNRYQSAKNERERACAEEELLISGRRMMK